MFQRRVSIRAEEVSRNCVEGNTEYAGQKEYVAVFLYLKCKNLL